MGLFEKQRQLLLQEKRRYELILILQIGSSWFKRKQPGPVVGLFAGLGLMLQLQILP